MTLGVLDRLQLWWRSPITRRERIRSACIGAVAGIWVGLLVCVLLTSEPVGLGELGIWALLGHWSVPDWEPFFPVSSGSSCFH